jgi:hypothetical protein
MQPEKPTPKVTCPHCDKLVGTREFEGHLLLVGHLARKHGLRCSGTGQSVGRVEGAPETRR